ncbi:MAG TPA: hypothetical protein VGK30_09105 [Candidatus Binatia bacterium]|jgi:hypothetical protein
MAETLRRSWAPILGALLLVACAARVEAASALVRWAPSNAPGVLGYRVYSRAAGHPYASSVDVGRPTPQADGNLAYTATNLGSGTYYFAVLAYGNGTAVSPLSAELPLGTPDPCLVDRCPSTTSCDIHTAGDGSSCDDGLFCNGLAVCHGGSCVNGEAPDCDDGVTCTDDTCDEALARCKHTSRPNCCLEDVDCIDSDVCTSGERCIAGSCVSQPEICALASCTNAFCDPVDGCGLKPVPDGVTCEACGVLRPRKMTVGTSADRGKLTLKATFDVDVLADPSTYGLLFELTSPNGTLLYRGNIPHDMFVTGKNGTKYRFLANHGQESATNGVTGALLRLRGTAWQLTLRAKATDILNALHQDGLGMILSFGFACASDERVNCRAQSAAAVCR